MASGGKNKKIRSITIPAHTPYRAGSASEVEPLPDRSWSVFGFQTPKQIQANPSPVRIPPISSPGTLRTRGMSEPIPRVAFEQKKQKNGLAGLPWACPFSGRLERPQNGLSGYGLIRASSHANSPVKYWRFCDHSIYSKNFNFFLLSTMAVNERNVCLERWAVRVGL